MTKRKRKKFCRGNYSKLMSVEDLDSVWWDEAERTCSANAFGSENIFMFSTLSIKLWSRTWCAKRWQRLIFLFHRIYSPRVNRENEWRRGHCLLQSEACVPHPFVCRRPIISTWRSLPRRHKGQHCPKMGTNPWTSYCLGQSRFDFSFSCNLVTVIFSFSPFFCWRKWLFYEQARALAKKGEISFKRKDEHGPINWLHFCKT